MERVVDLGARADGSALPRSERAPEVCSSLVATDEGIFRFPALAVITLLRVHPKGTWEVMGHRMQQRCFDVLVEF